MTLESTPIHWTEDRVALSRRLREPPRLLVASDFDGTLSTIAPTPDEATLAPGAAAVLGQVAALPGVRVAIVSGRALSDLAVRVPVDTAVLVGNHGLEMSGLGFDGEQPAATAHRDQLGLLMQELQHQLEGTPGLLIENKGLTGSVHYRNVPTSHFPRLAGVMTGMGDGQEEFEIHHGKMVWEVKPRIALHKGTALRAILRCLDQPDSSAVYLGDDTTDEFAFQTLPEAVTIQVGPPRPTAARWRAEDAAEVVAFFAWLVALRTHRG